MTIQEAFDMMAESQEYTSGRCAICGYPYLSHTPNRERCPGPGGVAPYQQTTWTKEKKE